MTKFFIIPIYLFALNAVAAENSTMYRKYHCDAEGPDHTKYLADIFYAGLRTDVPFKGNIVMRTENDSLPQLIQDVAMHDERNENNVPCKFISEFTLNWGRPVNINLNIDTCSMRHESYTGIATVVFDNDGKQQKYETALNCKAL